ncbi:dihydropteroate synthase [Brachybacterium hainanense]|uniref:Dihydropteroate synthase n=1 Tax=Brachybacterium hainanense TaxID=1541174 RepID=A0ABV6RIE1_9MICO
MTQAAQEHGAVGTGPRPLPRTGIAVMAIVNRTTDSFYDQGATWELQAAIDRGLAAVADGAAIIDIGGVKFAPGEAVPAAEEAGRVVPVVAALREQAPGALLSVDTFHASVAREVVAAGADIVNDTTGFADPEMPIAVAELGAGVVITHSLAAPRTELPHPRYDDVVAEVAAHLGERVALAREAGIAEERIIVDPGPDLNKSTVQTLELLRGWEEFGRWDLPVLAALSRKDVIGESLGLPKEERLEGSLAAAAWVIARGARILRVHDVRETVRLVRMLEIIAGTRDPAGPLVHNA